MVGLVGMIQTGAGPGPCPADRDADPVIVRAGIVLFEGHRKSDSNHLRFLFDSIQSFEMRIQDTLPTSIPMNHGCPPFQLLLFSAESYPIRKTGLVPR